MVLAFILYQAFRRVDCPECGDRLPVFYSPFRKTRRVWRAGGYLCARCGCETNMAGQKVTADTPPAPFPSLQCASLVVALLVGIGLAVGVMVVAPSTAVPPVAARRQ